jgi:hypothetical protein
MRSLSFAFILAGAVAQDADNSPPPDFTALFNGKDLAGWQGLIDLPTRATLSPEARAARQKEADEKMRAHWTVKEGVLQYDGHGDSLQTTKDYGDFELWVDWKIEPHGDSGIYLRGNPQVQIWDPADRPEGSGGLYNNKKNPNKPLQCADKPIGEWNRYRIVMKGEKADIWLNGVHIVDDVTLENYWEPEKSLPAAGPIELQHHDTRLWFKNIYIRELEGSGK